MRNRIVQFLLCIKDLFTTHPKRAYVLKCHTCKSVFWSKDKIRSPEKMSAEFLSYYGGAHVCPNCETKSSLFVPSDITIKEQEKMWRFLDDQDKKSRDDLARQEQMEEKYANVWHLDNPGFLHEITEKIRENLR